jgi:hypothetical protein
VKGSANAQPLVFISYRVNDTKRVAAPLARDLQCELEVGKVFLDRMSIDGGKAWPQEIRHAVERARAVLVLVGPDWLKQYDHLGRQRLTLRDDWVRQELEVALGRRPEALVLQVLVEESQEPVPREALEHIPSIAEFADLQRIRLRLDDWDDDLAKLLRLLETAGFKRRAADAVRAEPMQPVWEGSPFPGLRTFTPADEPIFFGRERETDFLVEKLADARCRFLLVVGTSGSGKSSLVGAGLIPRLAAGALPGSDHWLLPQVQRVGQGIQWIGLRFRPGEQGPDPFLALATRLAPLLPGDASAGDLAQRFAAAPDLLLVTLIEQALEGRAPEAEALLFVDQFEELVTEVTDPVRRMRFVEMLVSATLKSPRLRLVSTVRGEFFHRCIEAQPVLAELLRDRGATVPLAGPGASALTRMIEGPARRAGLTWDVHLVDRLVGEAVARAGGLALLAVALDELYKGATDRRLCERFDGLAGVINARAEATFATLPREVQACLTLVFGELVLVDEQGLATRRRAAREEVERSAADARRLVDAFTNARLLVTDQGPQGESVVEVAHEALLREWPRLATWITERADDLHLKRQVEVAARQWERHDEDPLYSWPHERLVPVYASFDRLGIARDTLKEPTRAFVRPEAERLLDELEKPETPHVRRVEIGDRLDRIGDPRPGVGLRPDGTPAIVWCEIPAGQVHLEDVQRPFEVNAFHLAKYPITYRQYKAFVDDPEGYSNGAWWTRLRHEDKPGEQYRPICSCPADNVSWHDAMAFCRWLSERLGFEVRLPHEAEWQQAATGGDPDNVYPWGRDWIDGVVNTSESRLGRTTAVGVYPRGRSAQRVLDLAGNVWEWCSNGYKYPRGGVRRVVRGGSGTSIRSTLAPRTASSASPPAIATSTSGFGSYVSPPFRTADRRDADHWISDLLISDRTGRSSRRHHGRWEQAAERTAMTPAPYARPARCSRGPSAGVAAVGAAAVPRRSRRRAPATPRPSRGRPDRTRRGSRTATGRAAPVRSARRARESRASRGPRDRTDQTSGRCRPVPRTRSPARRRRSLHGPADVTAPRAWRGFRERDRRGRRS